MKLKDNMIQDLHSHTYYSNCGIDDPKLVIEVAIAGGITDLGITDHNYGIGDALEAYCKELSALREEYKDKINLYPGIEISSFPDEMPSADTDLSLLDYCIIENLQYDLWGGEDIVEFVKRMGIPGGIAHTDLFGYCSQKALEPLSFFKRLAENNIFWEMNVNYDSIHGWREHEYVTEFMNNTEQQKIIKESGISLSVGFDGHRIYDYNPERVIQMNNFIKELCIPLFVPKN